MFTLAEAQRTQRDLPSIRKSDFSRGHRQFATKVATSDNKPLRSLRLCEKTGCSTFNAVMF